MSRSSTEVEYQSLASLVAELIWVRNLLDEIQVPLQATPMVYCDNMSVVLLATNPILHSKSKHFKLDLYFIRDYVAKGHVQISHILAHAQVVDVLTKPVSSAFFHDFRAKLKIVDSESLSLSGEIKDKHSSEVS